MHCEASIPTLNHSNMKSVMTENPSVPGTLHLVDIERTLRTKHASGNQNDIVLIPAPSDHPDDPLNWSAKRKLLSTACISIYTFAVGTTASAIYSILEPIERDTGLTLNDLNAGTGYMFLLFGWGCLFWQPLALQYGKRPVYLISMLATTVSPRSTWFGSSPEPTLWYR